ncbi:hypothetical protein [Dyadobacter sp. CY312]|uniref:hypothetical protein n=1 Tax=Dyadobacter sp. CY312 TaxID=2907303 RepID=UPI001F31FB23|nr:hypothetical protein [Dyadobacter sp. CY312]MCE7042786.1 hypothetical protein [Dyadobacter sp. CY312]
MKYTILAITLICSTGFIACGQRPQQKLNNQTTKTVDTSKLTNQTVKAAFDAWQKGDSKTFISFFTADAKLYDDGSPRNFQAFVKEACGHEKFTTIDKVENEGKDIFGNFHTEKWGDFRTYFKFHFDAAGKVDRLDIGQAN